MRILVFAVAVWLSPVSAATIARGAPTSERHDLVVPLGLDLYIPAPISNPITGAKAELGRRLFFDRRLSGDGRTSCATCHQPERSFTDGRQVSRGVFGREGRRNVPSILNRAYGSTAFWDGRAASLEEQVRLAVAGAIDLGLPMDQAVERLALDMSYAEAFETAYGENRLTPERLVRAIATFVRTQLSGNSAYDRFINGERTAMSPEARRGMALFMGTARCARCHSGPLLSDEEFHNTGVSWGKDAGRYWVTASPADRGRFKTPSLRNVVATAPYMHDGSLADLDAVVRFYEGGGGANPNRDEDLRP
ncbi:MAG: cytochrome-c peroxidase [Acidobacteria bacterium]|nr:cytochrome-c peroxidase [Acidobacteriota bacterium]